MICKVRTRLPTPKGTFYLMLYENDQKEQHLAITHGIFGSNTLDVPTNTDLASGALPFSTRESHDGLLIRIHSSCFTGETIGSMRCDCAVIMNV